MSPKLVRIGAACSGWQIGTSALLKTCGNIADLGYGVRVSTGAAQCHTRQCFGDRQRGVILTAGSQHRPGLGAEHGDRIQVEVGNDAICSR